jgi:adenylate cyclase
VTSRKPAARGRGVSWPAAAACLGIGALVFLLVAGLRALGVTRVLDFLLYDLFLNAQPRDLRSASEIVVVGAGEEDLRTLGHYPVADAELATAIENLLRRGARAVGFDIFRDLPAHGGREKLDAVLLENKNVVAIFRFGAGGFAVPPPSALADAAHAERVGFNDFIVDDDEVMRRGLLFLDSDNETDETYTSFSLQLARLYLAAFDITPEPDPENPELLRLGKRTFRPLEPSDGPYMHADTRGYQFLIDFRGPRRFRTLPFLDVLQGRIAEADVRGKIVIIGNTNESVPDFIGVPLRDPGRPIETRWYGVEGHAVLADNILRAALHGAEPVAFWPKTTEFGWLLLWSLLGAAAGILARVPLRLLLAAILGLVLLTLGCWLAFLRHLWLPLASPALSSFGAAAAVTAFMAWREKAQRGMMRQLFVKLVSQAVAETLWEHRDQLLSGGKLRTQELTATVLFTDLRGFTALSENRDPVEVMGWLNEYMERISSLITRHGGMVSKYIGDSIMALFGVPIPRTSRDEVARDAQNAVASALAMRAELADLNRRWLEKGLPAIGMRIGILTGPLVAGTLGSSERLEYTVIGETVNTASRLEGYDKELMAPDIAAEDCRILIGEDTNALLDGRFQTRIVGETVLKGMQKRLTVYGVIGAAPSLERSNVEQSEKETSR